MKKIFFGLTMLFASLTSFGQLEGVLVDKVPAGSLGTTYRVFVDMAPDWKMQSVFALTGHELFFNTTTTFFNESVGVTFGANLLESLFGVFPNLKYDSYLTISAGTSTSLGVPTSVDPDGLIPGTVNGTSFVGDDPAVSFGTIPGASFSSFTTIYNVTPAGGIAELPGADAQNRVFIGQFTTTGDFSFEINVQLRNTILGQVRQYVARNPVGGEILDTRLRYTSVVIAPTVSITSPSAGSYSTGTPLNLYATAADGDVSVVSVSFYRNSVAPANLIGPAVYDPTDLRWEIENWPATSGAYNLIAVATDNDGNPTTSAPVGLVVTTPANDPPSVVLNVPTPGQQFNLGTPIVLTATASDPQGAAGVTVTFYVNGTPYAAAGTYPNFTYSYNPAVAGPISVYARVSDGSLSANSATVNALVVDPSAGFLIEDKTAVCYESEVFCMPIRVTTAVNNVLGFDIPLEYERTKVQPTGVVYVKTDLLGTGGNYNWVSVYTNIDDANGIMYISLAINGSAPAGTEFNGLGELICVEFAKTIAFGTVNSADFTSDGIDVSKATQVTKVLVSDGTFNTVKEENFNGELKFWKDNSPIAYTSGVNLITDIIGSVDCVSELPLVVRPDAFGEFVYNTSNGAKNVKIERDIAASTDVQDVINGADAQLVARVIVNDVNYKPNIFQMLAMDVNRDGLVSAGDLTQIMQRTVSAYDEFKQAINYNPDGTVKSANAKPTLDWVFVPADTIYAEQFRISTNWPFAEPAPGKGYSRFGLPVADTCHKIKIIGSDCPIVLNRSYLGIMLGDVNGSYAAYTDPNPAVQALLKSSEKDAVVFDLANATSNGRFVDVPVYFASNEEVTSVDFAVRFDREALQVESIVKNAAGLESADFYNSNDNTLRFTSYSLNALEAGKNLVTVRFNTNGNELKSSDLTTVAAYVNGNRVSLKVADAKGLQTEVALNVYPNPAADMLNVEVSVDAKLQLMDVTGRSILFETDAVANRKAEINVSGLANGNYMLKVYNNSFVKVQKVVIQK